MDAKEVFLQNVAQTSPYPLIIEVAKAEGSYIFDAAGKAYLDMISGIAVTNIGHRHPKVVSAIKDQLDKYMHVMAYGEFIQQPQHALAKKLDAILPDALNCTYFVNSGAEAIEGAMKLAKRVTGRTGFISCKGAYHGSTHGALSVSGNETKKYRFRPLLPDVRFIRHNHLEDLSLISESTAAVIIELIQGDAGVRIADASYVKALRKKCTENGTLLIVDEIQTGFGRTGKWFSFQHYDIVPDVIAIAKGFGGGMPIGAFISDKKKMAQLSVEPVLGHITTFGGHPVNCASALANLEVIEEECLIDEVEAKGAYFAQAITHPAIKEIRRKGLMFAIEFDTAELVQKIVEQCLEHGLITFYFLSCRESFRLAPPLNISYDDLDKAAHIIKSSIDQALT
jgi:acetylornithine/N-succinyldiaminopimelate aminotransferase